MNRLLVLAALILTGAASVDKELGKRERRAEVVYSAVFLKKGEPPYADVKISKGVSKQTINAVPDTNGEFAMIDLECRTVSAAGKMGDCKIEVQPESDALKRVGERASRDIVVDRQQMRSTGDNLDWISIHLLVSNSTKKVTSGPCWPPSCHFIPMPPPPPPPAPETSPKP